MLTFINVSRFSKFCFPGFLILIMAGISHKIIPSLPAIKASIGHIPQRLKTPSFENPQGRLEILRRMVTQMVREERVEYKQNRAVECRPYLERVSIYIIFVIDLDLVKRSVV